MPAAALPPTQCQWGFLVPINPSMHPIPLVGHQIAIGRSTRQYLEVLDDSAAQIDYVVLDGPAVSNTHAVIHWNGQEGPGSIVTITDYSSNGTFVDDVRIQNTHHLFTGSTISFGCKVPIPSEAGDFRYTFHNMFGRSKTESVFTHYDLLECIGDGGFGTVSRAVEKTSGKVYAIKTVFYNPEKPERYQHTSIFLAGQETMAMMILEHENICKLQEVFFRLDGQVVDIVMEYVDGIGLNRLLGPTIPLAEAHIQEIAYQLCTAIAYMHDKNAVHGDLKPDNVLITRTHPSMVKVIDFGLARVVGNVHMQQVAFHRYIAPEAALQQDRLGASMSHTLAQRWDSWGIGCILFELFTSEQAFVKAVIKQVEDEDRAFEIGVDHIRWNLLEQRSSNSAHDFVRRLLAVDPHDRMTVTSALHHPWLANHTPHQTALADVLLLAAPPPRPARIVPLQELGSDTEEDEMDVDAPAARRAGLRPRPKQKQVKDPEPAPYGRRRGPVPDGRRFGVKDAAASLTGRPARRS